MKVAVFSTKPFDREFLEPAAAEAGHELVFFDLRLTEQTSPLADGFDVVSAFVNDELDEATLGRLSRGGVRMIAMRSAGFNNIDLRAAERLEMCIARVPAYSPHAVAEHAVGLILALNRKLYRAYNRVREGNFTLEGLLGFDLYGRTIGVIGTGRIGAVVARIMTGFGCHVLAYDVATNAEVESLGVGYVELDELFSKSDIITLHCPLLPETRHMINADALAKMRDGVMLINTSRGALIDTGEVVRELKSGKIGSLGLDVYEEEGDLFFEDLSNQVIQDDVFSRMLTFPNVLITAHQAFFTRDALAAIAEETMTNITAMANGEPPPGVITCRCLKKK